VSDLSTKDVVRIARRLYVSGSRSVCLMQRWRPYICPYHTLIEAVPVGSTVLDVGCGAGLVLGVLADTGRIAAGIGFDASRPAIGHARAMVERLPASHGLDFWHLDVEQPWPRGDFDVVSMVDVLHHVPPRKQRAVFDLACDRVTPGATLLYKDMAAQPRWRSAANRLHDLVVARQWIHHVPSEAVIRWSEANGLVLREHRVMDVLWYRHDLAVLERPR
jgi:2-polyprenyl-3-methyl-5-hydroxy-6-metoxy-1,4-benzoquinol methylase